MSYLTYWQLPRSPFGLQSGGQGYFAGGTIEEAFARCDFLMQQSRKLAFVIGPSGVGKSSFLDQLALKQSIRNPKANWVRLDLQSTPQTQTDWNNVEDTLFGLSAVGRKVTFLVDNVVREGTENDDVFNALSRLCRNRSDWLMLLAVDDDALPDLPRWLLESCHLRVDLPRWDLGQTADYFDFALEQVGYEQALFDAQSITRVQELSDGIPRRILQLAELALVAGAVRQTDRIHAELVEEVYQEFAVAIGSNFPVFWHNEQLNVG